MTLVYGLAIFLSAGLLFSVEPLVAKSLLPLLGGSPAVWNTCMVFFQSALLAGYAYAHGLTRLLGIGSQVAVHLVLVLLATATLPLAMPVWRGGAGLETVRLLGVLVVLVGAPFFVLSATGPLLQRWFAATRHVLSGDPYFLYALSNAGSLLGLLAYPLVLEPTLALKHQGRFWSVGFGTCALLLGAAGVLVVRRSAGGPGPISEAADRPAVPIGWARRLRWMALAFVPSSLLLGATHYLSTDIAAIPLLWVVPLAIYLVTLVSAFGRRLRLPVPWSAWIFQFLALELALTYGSRSPLALIIPIHLVALGAGALLGHTRLADDRPPPAHLTDYYLLISVGGALGGVFHALVAPVVFDWVAEYPLSLVAACLLVPAPRRWRESGPVRRWSLDLLPPLVLGAAYLWLPPRLDGIHVGAVELDLAARLALSAVAVFLLGRPVRSALLVGTFLWISLFAGSGDEVELARKRTFFGVLSVERQEVFWEGEPVPTVRHRMLHGTTLHGFEDLDRPRTPLGYYHRRGPVGQLLGHLEGSGLLDRVGVVGLGSGAITTYAESGQRWTFYEIDRAVVEMASDERLFTYLRDARADVEVVLGDGRLSLASEPDGELGLLVVDAFTSDAIPVHLLTREALALYLRKVEPEGWIALHVSNRYLKLAPVVAAICRELAVWCAVQDWYPGEELEGSADASSWVVVARRPPEGGPLADERWRPLDEEAAGTAWTDGYSNLLGAVQWRGVWDLSGREKPPTGVAGGDESD